MPTAEVMPRAGRASATTHAGAHTPPAWSEVESVVTGGVFSLATASPETGPHQVPVFAAWNGDVFFVPANAHSVKHHQLSADGRCALTRLTDDMHVAVEAIADHVIDPGGLGTASAAFSAVYDWPTTVADGLLDAPYGAPTSGGPPYHVWRLTPVLVFTFPTDGEAFAPTRWRF